MATLLTIRERTLGELTVREVQASGATTIPAHEHRASHLTLVTAGMVTDRADDVTEVLRAGDALFRPAGVHENAVAEPGSHGLVVELGEQFLAPFCVPFGHVSRSVRAEGTTLRDLTSRALEEFKTNDPLTSVVFPALILQILATGLRSTRGTELEPPPQWIARAMHYVDVHYREPISMRDVAAAAGVSSIRLRHGLRRWYGRTLGTMLRERRIAAAMELLETERPLSEIALDCGFYDQSHFTRSFHAVRGISPQRYRARIS